ncbi:MAG: amidophosphoribosyltransferase [Oscillospiraceae bacterium]|nr:amidophosphoribosyltransferase [Oscillospiraceae bacterium]
MGKIHEACGVFGIYDNDGLDVVSAAYYALNGLQHRGQESAGIAVNDGGVITGHSDAGLANEVFTDTALRMLPKGSMALGHVMYGTLSGNSRMDVQPIIVNHIKGNLALAHNGALTNAAELRRGLENNGMIFRSTSDCELISSIIVRERLGKGSIEDAVSAAMNILEGAYSLVIMSPTKMLAARDPFGFRPLCIGKIKDSFVFASESSGLDSIGAEFLRDVKPGEIVVADKNGLRSIEGLCSKKNALCVFEFVYFARPDSVIDGSSVHNARRRAGAFLALDHPVMADVVIGVPDSGIDAAIGYSQQSGIPYGLGFIKNKYIGRTFIQPVQTDRENKVRIKLNPVADTVKGKRVVLVDDSIVRGTTCARIVNLLREAGAKEVHMRVSSPPFLYPCYFGTDIKSRDILIAANHTEDEIKDILGVDSLGYMSVENIKKIASNTKVGFCTGCFTGKYPCNVPECEVRNKYSEKIK